MKYEDIFDVIRKVANGEIVEVENPVEIQKMAIARYDMPIGIRLSSDLSKYAVFHHQYHPEQWLDQIDLALRSLVKAREFCKPNIKDKCLLPNDLPELTQRLEQLICDFDALWYDVQERGKRLRHED